MQFKQPLFYVRTGIESRQKQEERQKAAVLPVLKKLNWVLIIIAFCFAILIFRLAQLQIIQGDQFDQIAQFNIVRTTLIPPPRGEIRDRFGKPLAYDVPRLNVCAKISEIEDQNVFVKKLAPLIDTKPERIKEILEKNKDDIYRKILIKPRIDTEMMMVVAESQGDLPGLYLEVQPMREYPHNETASHVLGYVGEITEDEIKSPQFKGLKTGDIVGKDGIEKYYDQYLQGRYGTQQELVNAAGKVITELKQEAPSPGYVLYLTLDLELQKECDRLLGDFVSNLSAISRESLAGTAIIMDSRNNEVLAMSSYPRYNPNLFARGITSKEYEKLIQGMDYPLLNRCISGAYPAASTYKIITAAAGLEEGLCTRYSQFYCSGKYLVGSHVFNCFVRSGHGPIDFNKSMSESCDVTFYLLGESMGLNKLLHYSREFGIGEKTQIDLPGETAGLLPDELWKRQNLDEPWYTGDTVNIAIGQGYLGVTPLQMGVVIGAVVHDGIKYKPHLLKRVERVDGKILKTIQPEELGRIQVKKMHFDALKDTMRDAVLTGTAKSLRVPKMYFAGKTGTAESFASPENPNGRNHTWFVGYGPFDDPEIILVVFLEKSGDLAGRRAVPLSGSILESYYNIMSERKAEQKVKDTEE